MRNWMNALSVALSLGTAACPPGPVAPKGPPPEYEEPDTPPPPAVVVDAGAPPESRP
jgi:hypothetical protein